MKQSGFWAGMFSEADGTPSSSRFIMLVANLVWFSMIIWRFHRTGQMPSQDELLYGGLGANASYGLNQLKQIVGSAVPQRPAQDIHQVAVQSQPQESKSGN